MLVSTMNNNNINSLNYNILIGISIKRSLVDY